MITELLALPPMSRLVLRFSGIRVSWFRNTEYGETPPLQECPLRLPPRDAWRRCMQLGHMQLGNAGAAGATCAWRLALVRALAVCGPIDKLLRGL